MIIITMIMTFASRELPEDRRTVAVIMDGEVSFSISCSSVQGDRRSMEDELAIQFLDKNHAILGISDGHCGREAAAYAKDNLIPSIVVNSQRLNSPPSKIKKVLQDAFLKVHNEMASLRGNNNNVNNIINSVLNEHLANFYFWGV